MTDLADDLLQAHSAFYQAIRDRSVPEMENLWAEGDAIVCIHPGWAAIFGRDAILASWRGILSNPAQPPIVCSEQQVMLHGDTGIVVCIETVSGARLVATNTFVRQDGQWRMVHHQAGPVSTMTTPERPRSPSERRTIH